MSHRGLTLLVSGVLAVGLLVAGYLLPVPYVVLSPGLTQDTLGSLPGTSTPLIRVTGDPKLPYPTNGHLILLTVYLTGGPGQQPTLFGALGAWFNHEDAVIPQQFEFPPGQSSQQVEQQNTQQMDESQQDAITAALGQLGIPGTIVVQMVDTPAAEKVLKPGDAVLAVDGHPVYLTATLRQLIGAHRVGQSVRLTVRRGAHTFTVTVPTTRGSDGSPVVGIVRVETPTPPLRITIDLTDVGGPSAGMMFALGLIDKLTPGGITGGRSIAGTGTIDFLGNVGPIGGITQKVFAALNAGATVFLAPESECADALAVAPAGLRLIPVTTLSGAVQDLRNLTAGRPVPHC